MPQPTEFWLLSLTGSVNLFNIWSCIWDFHQHRIERNRENEMYKPQISLGFLLARAVQPIPRICSHWAIKSMRGQQQLKDFAAGRRLKIAKPPFPLACSRRFFPCRVPCREGTPTCIHLEWIPPCTSFYCLQIVTAQLCAVMQSIFARSHLTRNLNLGDDTLPRKRHFMVSHTLPPYREGLQTDLCGKDQYISCPVGHTKYLKWPLTLL